MPGGTANRWDAAVGQNDITLVKGESYRFSFSAKGAPDGHVVRAIVGLSVAPYDTYFEVSPQLSVSGNKYSYTFTAPVDTAQGQVGLQLGGSAERTPLTPCRSLRPTSRPGARPGGPGW
ncbi:hypothetical protein SALBM311S_00053 [Streptomyces alboniger]